MFHIHIKLNALGRDAKATHATYKAFNDGEPQVLKHTLTVFVCLPRIIRDSLDWPTLPLNPSYVV